MMRESDHPAGLHRLRILTFYDQARRATLRRLGLTDLRRTLDEIQADMELLVARLDREWADECEEFGCHDDTTDVGGPPATPQRTSPPTDTLTRAVPGDDQR